MALWVLNQEVLGSLWLLASANKRGGSLHLKASKIGEGGRCPFGLYNGICLTTEEEHGKTQSGQPSSWRLLVAPTWLPFYGQPRLAC
jgi:hypothetical protein